MLIVFAFFGYWGEVEEVTSKFTSLGEAIWWAIVTMTTVGYGDILVLGIPGKCVGALCALSGVLMLILPLAALILNYTLTYDQLVAARALRVQQRKQGITYVASSTIGHGEAGLYPPPPTDVAAL